MGEGDPVRKERGRSVIYSGDKDWLLSILAKLVQDFKPGEDLTLEFFRFLRPEDLYGLQIRPGNKQEEVKEKIEKIIDSL